MTYSMSGQFEWNRRASKHCQGDSSRSLIVLFDLLVDVREHIVDWIVQRNLRHGAMERFLVLASVL
jgi:hypothetical protein